VFFLALIAASAQAQWQIDDSTTTADLRGISSVGNGIAWASGSNGTVLRTEDGGFEWQPCTVPPGAERLDFRGIQGFDANAAIVIPAGRGIGLGFIRRRMAARLGSWFSRIRIRMGFGTPWRLMDMSGDSSLGTLLPAALRCFSRSTEERIGDARSPPASQPQILSLALSPRVTPL